MQSESKLFDDLAKLANSALGSLHGLREEIEGLVRQRVDRLIADMDLVPREEFDVVKAMAVAAREENETLKKRLEALEKTTASGAKGGKKGKTGGKTGGKTQAQSQARSKRQGGARKTKAGGKSADTGGKGPKKGAKR